MPPLALDSQDALQGSGGDPQPLGNSDVIFYSFIDIIPAHHQHAGAPEQVAPHINTIFMFLRHCIIEEQRQVEQSLYNKVGSTLSPRPFPFMGKGAALEDIPPPPCRE